ncbi:unnamed protein product [Staurois parvus]|uniref:Uncharacterized protein n=1 Tax=Staurois parvus TaxID=386267 RepID=A0ABN9E014_9NEOB|nr:unnamed protein product [Staurois parvus]
MIGTSRRGPVRRSVFHCVWRTQRAPDREAGSNLWVLQPTAATRPQCIAGGQSASG